MWEEETVLRSMKAIIVSCILLSGCATSMYDEKTKRGDSEVAHLELNCALIDNIDGVPTPYNGGGYGSFKVLPGFHTLSVSVGCGYRSAEPLPIAFDAEAGRTYSVGVKTANQRWRPQVVDKNTGQDVGRPASAK